MRLRLFFIAALCLGLTGLASGQVGKVTLDLSDVSATEAIEALARYSDRELVLARAPDPAQSASFNWKEVPFSQALRQVCERFDLRVLRGAKYHVSPRPKEIPEAHRERIAAIKRDGYELMVSSRKVRPTGGAQGPDQELQITVDVKLADQDWSTLDSIRPVRAQDDLGNVVTRSRWSGFPQRFHLDEWAASFGLGPIHPKARRLVWLEGELNAHKIHRHLEMTAGAPKSGAKAEVRQNGNRFEVGITGKDPHLELQAKLIVTPGSGLEVNYDSVFPRLVGASGKVYQAQRGQESYGKQGNAYRFDLGGQFEVTEPVKTVLVTWQERSPITPLFKFRLANIPLPGQEGDLAGALFNTPPPAGE